MSKLSRENRDDIQPRQQSEPLSREWSRFGSFFKSRKRMRRAPSKSMLVQRPHTGRVSQLAQQRSPKPFIPTVPEEPNEDIAAQSFGLRSDPSLEKFAYKASERSLSRSSPEDLTRALLSLRAENQQLKHASTVDAKESQQLFKTQERLEEQERRLALAQAEVSRMQKELEEEKIKSSEAEKVKNKAIRNLAKASAKADPYQYDDVFFKHEFKAFRYKINHWVRNQKWQLARNRNIPEKFKSLQSTTPYYVDYISSERGMQLLLGARIWQYLREDVFGKDLWADGGSDDKHIKKNRRAYDTFNDILVESVPRERTELHHDWRAATARIMAAREESFTHQALQKTIQDYCLDLKEDLELFAANDLDGSKSPSKGIKIKLEDLIREAISLDAIIQQQRPHFQFYPNFPNMTEKWNLRFSENSMEVPNDDVEEFLEGRQVKLVLVPGLYKYGNSVGRNYGQGCTILKANVDVMGAM